MRRPLHTPPFGLLEQRELGVMRELGARGRENLTLLTLRLRCDSTGWTSDSLASLARWAGLSTATVTRGLAWLVEHRMVIQEKSRRRYGGAQGAAWVWPRRPLWFEDWPEEVRALASSSLLEPITLGKESLSPSRRATHAASRTPDVFPDDLQKRGNYFDRRRGSPGLHRVGERFGDVGALIIGAGGDAFTTSTGKHFRSIDEWAAAVRHARSACQ